MNEHLFPIGRIPQVINQDMGDAVLRVLVDHIGRRYVAIANVPGGGSRTVNGLYIKCYQDGIAAASKAMMSVPTEEAKA